jgi:predicted flap endonuclease-1-like 5' DNA nuclease
MFQQNVTLGPGTGTFASHTFEILVMLLGAFLLGLWLGWVLWARYRQEADRLRIDNTSLQASVNTLTAELGTLQNRLTAIDTERSNLDLRVRDLDAENGILRDKLRLLQADLDGINSRNRQLETELALTVAEQDEPAEVIDTPLEIAERSPAPTPEIVVAAADVAPQMLVEEPMAGDLVIQGTPPTGKLVVEPLPTDPDDDFMFVMEQPTDVLESASTRTLAAPPVNSDDHFSDDAFAELTRSSLAPPTEHAPLQSLVLTPLTQDDLKIVEGIGPKIEELLFKAGIHTYSELAAAPVARLKEILNEAGPRYAMHDPGTWSAQALLAANGEWDNLKAYQGFLDAGKRPDAKG